MVDINVTLKVPAVEKLIDYVASGIGAIAGPMLAFYKAKPLAEVKRIEAQGNADSLKIIADAQADAKKLFIDDNTQEQTKLDISSSNINQTIEFQGKKRLGNIQAVVHGAAEKLQGKEVPNHEPDHDWIARFFSNAQDVSSKDMQKLWSKVLTGEVEKPGRTSLRTLDILKNMTKWDAEMFEDICTFVISDFIFAENKTVMENTYGKILHLANINLMHMSVSGQRYFIPPKGKLLQNCNLLLKISSQDKNPNQKIEISVYHLSHPGIELLSFTKSKPNMEYLKSFAQFIHSQNCQLSYCKNFKMLSDGKVEYHPSEMITFL